MLKRELTKGTGGNISIYNRKLGLVAISPSAVEYEEMAPEDVAVITLDGEQVEGSNLPSSEKDMHLTCFQKRKDVNAVVHTHSCYATALACLHEELPPVHYLIGFAGGTVRCIPYYLFGGKELANAAVEGMESRNAVLLGNHGLLTVGTSINHAFNVAEETEFIAKIYCITKGIGTPQILDSDDLEQVQEKFQTYGKAL